MPVLSAILAWSVFLGQSAAVIPAVLVARSNGHAAGDGTDTVVTDHDYRLTLPGKWRKESTKPGGPIVYRTPAGTEQVTITLLHSTSAQDSAAQRATLEAVVEKHRQAALKAYAPDQVTLTGVSFVERPTGPWASYFVLDLSATPVSFVRINASSWTVGTIFYEHKGVAPDQAKSCGLKILGRFTLTGAPPATP